jgi:hypothetical protein
MGCGAAEHFLACGHRTGVNYLLEKIRKWKSPCTNIADNLLMATFDRYNKRLGEETRLTIADGMRAIY